MNEIFIPHSLDKSEAKKVLSKVLGLSVSDLCVTNDIEQVSEDLECKVLIVLNSLQGEFKQSIELFRLEGFTDLYIAKGVSEYYKCPVLLSDDSVDPFSWWLWTGTQLVIVNIDPDFEDEFNGFKITEVVAVV